MEEEREGRKRIVPLKGGKSPEGAPEAPQESPPAIPPDVPPEDGPLELGLESHGFEAGPSLGDPILEEDDNLDLDKVDLGSLEGASLGEGDPFGEEAEGPESKAPPKEAGLLSGLPPIVKLIIASAILAGLIVAVIMIVLSALGGREKVLGPLLEAPAASEPPAVVEAMGPAETELVASAEMEAGTFTETDISASSQAEPPASSETEPPASSQAETPLSSQAPAPAPQAQAEPEEDWEIDLTPRPSHYGQWDFAPGGPPPPQAARAPEGAASPEGSIGFPADPDPWTLALTSQEPEVGVVGDSGFALPAVSDPSASSIMTEERWQELDTAKILPGDMAEELHDVELLAQPSLPESSPPPVAASPLVSSLAQDSAEPLLSGEPQVTEEPAPVSQASAISPDLAAAPPAPGQAAGLDAPAGALPSASVPIAAEPALAASSQPETAPATETAVSEPPATALATPAAEPAPPSVLPAVAASEPPPSAPPALAASEPPATPLATPATEPAPPSAPPAVAASEPPSTPAPLEATASEPPAAASSEPAAPPAPPETAPASEPPAPPATVAVSEPPAAPATAPASQPPAPIASAPAATPAPVAVSDPPAAPATAPASQPPAPAPSAPAATQAPTATETAAPSAAETEIANVWVANLFSSPSQAEADAAWARLSSLPSAAGTLYRYETTVDGSAVHRIRVGFFPDRSAALAAAQNLATAASLGTTPWAVQPNVTEARRFGAQAISDLWVVNLSSTPDEAESLALWQILEGQSAALEKLQDSRAKGLSALSLYRYDTSVGGRKQYRIRLGFFESAQAAQEAGRLLAEAASLPESRIGRPWTVRPSAGEAASYRKD